MIERVEALERQVAELVGRKVTPTEVRRALAADGGFEPGMMDRAYVERYTTNRVRIYGPYEANIVAIPGGGYGTATVTHNLNLAADAYDVFGAAIDYAAGCVGDWMVNARTANTVVITGHNDNNPNAGNLRVRFFIFAP